jgi:hypothetical protein
MSFSIHLKLPLAKFPTNIDWGAINATIAASTEQATWVTAWATCFQFLATAVAAFAAIAAAWFAWQALQTWRFQVLGEHEFGRLLKAVQAVHDIEVSIDNFRSAVRFQGGPSNPIRSNDFRNNISEHHREFLRETVGLDIFWSEGTNYQTIKKNVKALVDDIALAATYVHETPPGLASLKHHGLVASPNRNPADLSGFEDEKNKAETRIKNDIKQMQDFLEEKLRAYRKK